MAIVLTDEKFQEIYTDEAFRNSVAWAHECYNAQSVFLHKATCTYPIVYIVTEAQIDLAKKEKERAKVEAIAAYKGKMVLIGMGSEYQPRYEGDVCNHRARGEFFNDKGRKFFIEVCRGAGYNDYYVPHSIDRDLEEKERSGHISKQSYNNYAGLETRKIAPYTLDDVRDLINRTFDCSFKEVIVDNHNLSPDDIISKA